jgi:hypothetical protein
MSSQYIKPINDKIRQIFQEQANAPSAPPAFCGEGKITVFSDIFVPVKREEVRGYLSSKAKEKTAAKEWMPAKSSADTLAQWDQGIRLRYRTRVANWRMAGPAKYQVVRALNKQEAILDQVGA